jgi:hypothetical protein
MDEQLQCTVTKCILRRIISTQSGKYSVSWSLINYLVLSVNVPYCILMFKSITAYLIVVSCCCRLSYRWRLGRSLVHPCLLGMADTKAPRRRLATQRKHSHQPVTTLRATITTPLRL